MPTCLVTGGAGFLGSHLCDELLRRGHRVICVDNVETGSLANIEHIRGPEFRFEHADIIEPYFVDEPIDIVYHAASPASPIDYLRLPLHTLKVGSHGTHHTLGLAKAPPRALPALLHQRGLRRPGDPPAARGLLGQRQPDRPARRLRRGQALRRGADDGLPPPAGRRHGDRQDLQHLRGENAAPRRPRDPDLPAPGADRTGRSRSSATGPRRAASATSTTSSRASSRWPNPASTTRSTSATPTSTRCSSWPRRSSRSPESSSEIVYEALPVDDPKVRQPDITRARELLGWEPKVSLHEGLRRTIDQAGVDMLVGAPR